MRAAAAWMLSTVAGAVVMIFRLAVYIFKLFITVKLFLSVVPKLVMAIEDIATAVIKIGKLLFGILSSLLELLFAVDNIVLLYTNSLVTSAVQVTTQVVGYVLNLDWSLAANYISTACTAAISFVFNTLHFLTGKALSLLSCTFLHSWKLTVSILNGIIVLSALLIVDVIDTFIHTFIHFTKFLYSGTSYAAEVLSKMDVSATAETLYTVYIPYLLYCLLIVAACYILYRCVICVLYLLARVRNLLVRPSASSLAASSESQGLDSSAVQEDMEARVHLLRRELEREKEAKHCVVCLDRPRKLMIKPCNHYCVCEYCRRELTHCPMCIRRIASVETVYSS